MSRTAVKNHSESANIVLLIYSAGFLAGTFTHAVGIIRHGFLSHRAPLLFNVYWDTLTLLDPLTVLLLWIRTRLGVGLAVFIMASDIAINAYAYTHGFFGMPVPGTISIPLFLQSLFGLFVFVTAPKLMRS